MRRGLRSKALLEKRRTILLQKVYAVSFIIVFIFGAYASLSHIPEINISNIEVHGNNIVSQEELQNLVKSQLEGNYLNIFSKSNILLYSKSDIIASISDSYKRIKTIEVGRSNINTIYIAVDEREPHALWCNQRCYFLDSVGYIYTEAPIFSGNIFFTYNIPIDGEPIGTQLLSEDEFTTLGFLLELLEELEPIQLSLIDNIDFEIEMKDGSKIYFSRDKDFGNIYDNLESVLSLLEGSIEYIDLRFGSKVYYRYVE